MATVEFMDGGELGHLGLWDNPDSSGLSSGAEAAGFTGSYYFPGASKNGKTLTARTSYYFGFRCKHSNQSGCQILAIYGNNFAQNIGALQCNDSSGRLYWTNQSTGQWYSTMIEPTNTVQRYEVYILRNTYSGATPNNDGAVTLKINGVIVIQQTNIRSVYANYDIDGFYMNWSNYSEWTYDDVIVVQDAWPGNIRIQKCIPEGSGTNTEWDASAGSNFDCINEIPYDDGDFISTNTNDEIDTYQTSDLVEGTNPIDSILAVQLSARSKLEGSPTPQDIQLAIKSSSSYGYSGNKQVADDTWKWYSHVYNVDPATSSAWAKAAVNAMEIGVKAKART